MTIARYNLANSLGDNAVYLISLIIPYWLLKFTMSALVTPFTYLGVKWLRK
jgi:uncharacterized PurR-regulated membrane protein YhhQ (DUF165 family)